MPAVNQQGIKIMEVPPTQINNPEAIKSGLREALNGINPEAVQKLRLAVLAAFGDVDWDDVITVFIKRADCLLCRDYRYLMLNRPSAKNNSNFNFHFLS